MKIRRIAGFEKSGRKDGAECLQIFLMLTFYLSVAYILKKVYSEARSFP